MDHPASRDPACRIEVGRVSYRLMPSTHKLKRGELDRIGPWSTKGMPLSATPRASISRLSLRVTGAAESIDKLVNDNSQLSSKKRQQEINSPFASHLGIAGGSGPNTKWQRQANLGVVGGRAGRRPDVILGYSRWGNVLGLDGQSEGEPELNGEKGGSKNARNGTHDERKNKDSIEVRQRSRREDMNGGRNEDSERMQGYQHLQMSE